MPLNAEQRRLRAQIAANTRWANTDRTEATRPAREAFLKRFEDEVDPDRSLPEHEREDRARSAHRAHMQRLALQSSKSRAQRQRQ